MGEIYGRASQVLTWLGEASAKDDTSDKATAPNPPDVDYELALIEWGIESDVSLMREFFTDEKGFKDWPVVGALSTLVLLARDCHLNTLPFFQDPRYPGFDIGSYPSDLWQQSVKALGELLGSPYWSRVWIVQEIVRGNCVLIYYGRHVLPFEVFVDAQRLMRKHYYGCCYNHCAANANNKWSHLFGVLKKLDDIGDLGVMKSAQASQQKTSIFDTLLAGIDFREATDPRDQIYGLLGLIPDHRDDDLLQPDYTLSLAQVYTRAAVRIMRESGNLRLLPYADRHCKVEDLPSWCHDFNAKAPFNPQPYCWELFSSCNASDFNVGLNADSSLAVRGYHLDTVTHITEARTPESLSRASFTRWIGDNLKLARKQCAAAAEEVGNLGAAPPLHIDEAYGRTLISDTLTHADGSSRRATTEDIQLLYAWLRWMEENVSSETPDWAAREAPAIFKEIASSLLATTQSKKLFITKERNLGMGVSTVFDQEKEVLSGDQVWLLQGSNLPVILRRIPAIAEEPGVSATTMPTDSHSHYAFVGTTYVHGIMDGEACPSADMFTDITLGHYPRSSKSPSPANNPMRNALRMSLLLGHGSHKTDRDRSGYAPKSSARKSDAHNEGKEEEEHQSGVDAEAMLFQGGRQWHESMKPIPQHRVFFAALLENPLATEEEWEEFEKDLYERLAKDEEDTGPSSTT